MAAKEQSERLALSEIPALANFTVSNPRRSVRQIYDHLRDLILIGKLPPGATMSQVELGKILGVSRTPAREALRMLAAQGLVEFEPNYRATVRGVDPDELDAVYAERILTESLAVAITVKRAPNSVVESVEAIKKQMSRKAVRKDLKRWAQLHRDFHRLLIGSAGEHVLQRATANIEQTQRYVFMRAKKHLDQGILWGRAEEEHERLMECLLERDTSQAADLMGRHLGQTALELLATFAPEFEPVLVRSALSMVRIASANGSFDHA